MSCLTMHQAACPQPRSAIPSFRRHDMRVYRMLPPVTLSTFANVLKPPPLCSMRLAKAFRRRGHSARLCPLTFFLAAFMSVQDRIADAISLPREVALRLVSGDLAKSETSNMLETERQLLCLTPTPYGSVLNQLSVLQTTGAYLNIWYIKPAAFLWMSVKLSPPWAEFLNSSMTDRASAITLYMDDVRPGNQLRPDHGRVYLAWYWLLMALPEWFRTSQYGWFDLAFTQWTECLSIQGGVSALTDELLRVMDFPIQITLPSDAVPRPLWTFEFGVFMSDAKASHFRGGIGIVGNLTI